MVHEKPSSELKMLAYLTNNDLRNFKGDWI